MPEQSALDQESPQNRSFLFTRDRELAQEAAEDYAGRKVPYHWKRPVRSLAVTLFGAATSVFSFALGGQIALTSGMPTLIVALVIALVIAVPTTAVVMWYTAGRSMDTDLLSRGVGYGYRGSAITALIYALNWIMYAGFETAYLSAAIHTQWDAIPMWVLYLFTAMIIVPLNWFGISQMHWLQKWTVPLFVIGLGFVVYQALQRPVSDAAVVVPLSAESVLPALGAVLANVGIWILLIADYSRFVRSADRKKAVLVASTAGLGMQFLVLPILGGFLALRAGSANPGEYAVQLTGLIGAAWVVVTQLRVQEGNYYLGSLSLSVFFSRLVGARGGRPVYLAAVGVLAFVLALVGIENHLTEVLTFMGVLLLAWVSTLVTSLVVEARALRTGATWLEHRRPYLQDWGVPSLLGLAVGSVVGGALALADWPSPYGGFLGIVVGMVLAPAITLLGHRHPVRDIHSATAPPEDWRDAGATTDADLKGPDSFVRCAVTGEDVLRIDACELPAGSGRYVSARVAESE